MAKEKKLEHIQVKDNGIKQSQKIGDCLSDARALLERNVFDGLLKGSDETSLVRYKIAQNVAMEQFRRNSQQVIKNAKKEVKQALENDKTVNLTKKQVTDLTSEVNNGLLMLQNNAMKAYKSTVQDVVLKCKAASNLKEQLGKHLATGLDIGVVYKDGKTYKFDTYFEMKARTDIQQDIGKNMIAAGKEAGVIFYITSYYGDCAPDHVDYQGKIYVDKDWESLAPKDRLDEIKDYIASNKVMTVQEVSENDPFLTTRPNCRHYFQYISIDEVLGAKTEDDVKKLRDEKDLNFNGKYKPDKYKALQQQRLNERKIRASKEEIAKTQQALQLEPDNKTLKIKLENEKSNIRLYQKAQRDLAKEYSNIERRYDREKPGLRIDFGVEKQPKGSIDNGNNSNVVEDAKPITKVSNEELTEKFKDHFTGDASIVSDFVKQANTKDDNVYRIIANSSKLGKIEMRKGKPAYTPGMKNTITLQSKKDVRVAYHEFGHSLDHQVAYAEKWETENKEFHWVSDDIEEVRNQAKADMNNTIPSSLIETLDNQKEVIKQKVIGDIDKIRNKVRDEVVTKYRGLPSSLLQGEVENKLMQEIEKAYINYSKNDKEYTKWSCLSDIYDAITDGRATNARELTGHHGTAYYLDVGVAIKFTTSGNVKKQNTEIFANFCEMKFGNYEEQLNFLKKDQPKLYDKLEERFSFVAKYLEEKE